MGLDTCDATTYHAYATPLVRISEAETLAAHLHGLSMPVLYIYGQDARRGISKRSRGMLKKSPRIYIRAIKRAGHWVYLDQPQLFIRAVRAFIDR